MDGARILLCTLCDDVRLEVGNKHTLVGLFDVFDVADFAHALPAFCVFARLAVDRPGKHPFALRLVDGEGDVRMELSGHIDARQPNEASGLFEGIVSAKLVGVRVARPGRHRVEFVIGGKALEACGVLVRVAVPRVVQ